ncbi:phospholipase C, phosphocholine-specific, partial [Streptomyces tateyamensis]
LSATGPNRTYHWSGTIDPGATAGGPAYDGGDESGLHWQTYAEALQAAGVSWKVYQNAADNFGDNALAYFTQFTNAPAGSALAVKGMGSVPKATGRTPDDIAAAIKADVAAGALPQVCWIVADQQSSEHPYATPQDGAHFVHLVMDALNADPDVFNSTVLLLNYDENDGFFDHVPPPAAPPGTLGEFYNNTNIGLGFRVPLIAISPWTRGGWVNSETFDHTSVLRFMEVWTAALGTPANCVNISAWRRSVCGDLTGVFDFANPVYGMPALPDTSQTIGLATCGPLSNPAPANNTLPAQESGTRPARTLPYQPNANLDHLEFATGGVTKVWLAMDNTAGTGTTSAHFAAYANAYRSGGPWQYTVAPGSATSDFFNCATNYGAGKYDLTIVGPNRFLRRFTG